MYVNTYIYIYIYIYMLAVHKYVFLDSYYDFPVTSQFSIWDNFMVFPLPFVFMKPSFPRHTCILSILNFPYVVYFLDICCLFFRFPFKPSTCVPFNCKHVTSAALTGHGLFQRISSDVLWQTPRPERWMRTRRILIHYHPIFACRWAPWNLNSKKRNFNSIDTLTLTCCLLRDVQENSNTLQLHVSIEDVHQKSRSVFPFENWF